MKILTIYDGTLQSKTALRYGIKKTRATGGQLIVLNVFPSSMFLDYGAGPQAEAIARQEWAGYTREAEEIIREAGGGAAIRLVAEEGDPEQKLREYAASEHPDLVLATPRYKAVTKMPEGRVYLIPGTILVPIDNSDAVTAGVDTVIEEAKDTGSKVLLLGLIPVHLYSAEETEELEAVRKSTGAAMKKIKKAIVAQKIEVSEVMRSGYPDEEILKAAGDYSASLIVLPSGGKTPSELTKAAAVLLEEPERVPQPVCVLRAGESGC